MAVTHVIHKLAQFAIGTIAAGGITLLAVFWSQLAVRALPWLGRLRRVRFHVSPVPAHWLPLIIEHVPLVNALDPDSRTRLLRLVQVFLEDVPIEGCDGLEITDEIRLTIASQACLPLVNLPFPWYPKLKRILVYPGVFAPRRVGQPPGGQIVEKVQPTAGEAWHNGTVILSWESTRVGCANPFDGYNVVLHEFAHLLDGEDGAFDGVPILEPPSSYAAWALVFDKHYGALRRAGRRKKPRKGLLRDYGATKKSEFFAVSSEAFFEKPAQLRAKAPDLYRELAQFYRQDPAASSSQ